MYAVLISGVLAAATLLSAHSLAHAEACPDTYYLDDIPKGTAADFIHPLPATPGAFGGSVACTIAKSDKGVEQYWVEFLPKQPSHSIVVTYKQDFIRLRYTHLPEKRSVNLVECTQKTPEEATCLVDLSGGDGLYLLRSFTPKGAIRQVRLVARPNMGLINKTALPFYEEATPENRQVTLELVEAEKTFSMTTQPGAGLMSIPGKDIPALADVLFKRAQTLKFAYAFQRQVGDQRQNIASDRTISKGTVAFVLTQLFRLETLMVKGREGTVGFRF
ncbi:MAG: hypothetical protein AAFO98_04710 [Pseudomonadota bacterium]